MHKYSEFGENAEKFRLLPLQTEYAQLHRNEALDAAETINGGYKDGK